jgi:isoamylase
VRGEQFRDIAWLTPAGDEMNDEAWENDFAKSLQVLLNGEGLASRDAWGQWISDQSFLLLFNAHHEPLTFVLPQKGPPGPWTVVLDTTERLLRDPAEPEQFQLGAEREVDATSIVVLRQESQ